MKVNDCKKLVQNLLFSSKKERFTKKEILEKFYNLVEISRQENPKERDLYRILVLENENNIKPFELNSTSKKISSCLSIGDEMPLIIWKKDELKSLTPILFKFTVPSEKILLDIDSILPFLEKKLKNVLNHKVYNKKGEAVPIGKAISLYKEAEESEIIADLEDLPYSHVKLNKPFSFFSGKLIAKAFDERKINFAYKENVFEWLETLKPIMNEKDFKNATNWANEVYLNDVDLLQSLTNKNFSQSNKKGCKPPPLTGKL